MNKQSGTVAGSGVLTVWLWGLIWPDVPIPPEVAVVIGVAIMQPIGDVFLAGRDLIVQWLTSRKKHYEVINNG